MNSKSINRNVWALTLSLCLGVIFTHATGYAAEEQRAIGGVAEDMGRPGPMTGGLPVPGQNTMLQLAQVTGPTGPMPGGAPVGPIIRPGQVPCPNPNPVNLTLNVITPTAQGPFTAAQWALPRAGLNNNQPNHSFLGVFEWKPKLPKCCEFTATLTVNMQANQGGQSTKSSDAGNDLIGVNGFPAAERAVYTGPRPFSAGQTATYTWNLTPAALTQLENGGGLSFVVEDDTMVKSATLVLRGCCLNK